MQIILETDDAWSVTTLMVSQIIDQSGLSADGKAKVRRWRTDRADGTVEMDALAVAMNEALGTVLDDKTTRLVRQKGWYVSSREQRR